MKKRRNHSNAQLDRILMDIRALMQQNKSSGEIMELLGIPLRSYRRYTARIYKDDKELWNEMVRDELETQLLRLKTSLEYSFNICKELSAREDCNVEERLAAISAMLDCRVSAIQLLEEGASIQRKVESLSITATRAKQQHQEQRHP